MIIHTSAKEYFCRWCCSKQAESLDVRTITCTICNIYDGLRFHSKCFFNLKMICWKCSPKYKDLYPDGLDNIVYLHHEAYSGYKILFKL